MTGYRIDAKPGVDADIGGFPVGWRCRTPMLIQKTVFQQSMSPYPLQRFYFPIMGGSTDGEKNEFIQFQVFAKGLKTTLNKFNSKTSFREIHSNAVMNLTGRIRTSISGVTTASPKARRKKD